jgi:hypothetical protein
MDKKTVFLEIDRFFGEKCPGLTLSTSKKWQTWYSIRDRGEILRDLLENSYQNLRPLSNYPLFWLEHGASVEEAWLYSKNNKEWSVCNHCQKIFVVSSGHRGCCSEEHYKERRLIGNKKLSDSRKLYNPRDPEQYATRHKVSVEEATLVLEKIGKESTVRRPELWMKRGLSYEEALDRVSEIQKSVSPRCKEFYMDRGFSEAEATEKVAEWQSESSNIRKEKYDSLLQFSPWRPEFYIERGHDEEEAKDLASSAAKRTSKKGIDRVNEKYSKEERRGFSHFCPEYYQIRFPENWEEEFEKSCRERTSTAHFSKKATSFFSDLDRMFENSGIVSNRYFGDKEFVTYDKASKKVYMYDYVDTLHRVVVEYNGDYWHGNPTKYPSGTEISFPKRKILVDDLWENDKIKNQSMIDRGFRVFVVWESDVDRNAKDILINLYKEITGEDYKYS